jgi:hypothetical protein
MAQDEIDKRIEEKIQEKLQKGEIDRKIEDEITKDIEKDIRARVQQRVGQVIGVNQQPQRSRWNNFMAALVNFRSTFRFCWQGVCRRISFVYIFFYILTILLVVLCRIPGMPLCFQGGSGPLVIIIAVAVLSISFLISIFSSDPRTALVYTILLGIPILVLAFISSIQYIGLIIVGSALLIFLIRFIQQR